VSDVGSVGTYIASLQKQALKGFVKVRKTQHGGWLLFLLQAFPAGRQPQTRPLFC